jgi:hypothetical protein
LPSNRYLAKLTFLKTELCKVQAAHQASATTSANLSVAGAAIPVRGATWGMGSLNLAPLPLVAPQMTPIIPMTPVMSTLVAGKLQNLEALIKNREAQLVAEQVKLGGVNFLSPSGGQGLAQH